MALWCETIPMSSTRLQVFRIMNSWIPQTWLIHLSGVVEVVSYQVVMFAFSDGKVMVAGANDDQVCAFHQFNVSCQVFLYQPRFPAGPAPVETDTVNSSFL